ncbi:hypothetical protein BDFB_014063 [Asbolus verrucosus]|uniref:Protein hunchback n=1 Tax=Asbolus verrucosus TaxID=1661398 RepID=A0A482VUX3_ASBVE|nr:hypothetical protein BDFB_014063 [Asbolus verrucosus]
MNHVCLHRTRKKEDLFVCNLNSPQGYQCDSCEVVTQFKVLLNNHTNIVHKNFEVSDHLRHMLKSYECGECDFQTYSMVVLLKHFCDTTHGNLKENLRGQSSQRWFKCEYCQHRTRRKDHLKNHILCRHTNPEMIKWFQCEYCSYKTKWKIGLKSHTLQKHTNPENSNMEASSAKAHSK